MNDVVDAAEEITTLRARIAELETLEAGHKTEIAALRHWLKEVAGWSDRQLDEAVFVHAPDTVTPAQKDAEIEKLRELLGNCLRQLGPRFRNERIIQGHQPKLQLKRIAEDILLSEITAALSGKEGI